MLDGPPASACASRLFATRPIIHRVWTALCDAVVFSSIFQRWVKRLRVSGLFDAATLVPLDPAQEPDLVMSEQRERVA